MIKTITSDNKIIAIVLPHDFNKNGVEFFTPKDFSQQLGYMKHPKGHKIRVHLHKLQIRAVKYTQETLLVKSGRVRVDLYADNKEYLGSEELVSGDIIFLAGGGHGFSFLEESEMVEIKQGPYANLEIDKEHFEKTDE
ncbi:MAG: hypothetical protein ABID09_02745 [Candidatus Omnitrophota bacterium]